MKIAIIASLSESLISFRGHLISAMVSGNHEVFCVAPDKKALMELTSLGVKLLTTPLTRSGLNPANDLQYLFRLTNILNRIKPDLVLAYTIKPVIYGSLAAKFARIPQVYSIITGLGYAFMNETPKQKLAGLLAKGLYRIALKRNHKVFFQNPDDLKEFISYKILEQNKAVLINGSGVDLEYFAPVPLTNQPRFLLIARLLKEKGIWEFIEAAKMVKKVYPNASFAIVGPTDPSPSGISLEKIEEYVKQGIISYHANADDVRPFFKKANIYVLPSYREGTPRTVLEAMSMGRPIITTDSPGCRETVIDSYNGFLIPAKNASALAASMKKFIQAPDLIFQMGAASREVAEKKYNVHKVNQVLLANMHLISFKKPDSTL